MGFRTLLFASSIVSPILAFGHFFVLKRRSAVHIGFIGGADSWFALSFEGAAVTGVVVKSNTSPCNCRKSVPNITAVIKSFTTTKSWSFSSVPSRTVAFTYTLKWAGSLPQPLQAVSLVLVASAPLL